jgi:DNA polymerase-1
MCTIDKDLRTVEGWHFNWDKPEDGLLLVNTRTASLQFYGQILTGDHVDNYPGLPGCGIKTAARILDGCQSAHSMWDAVVGAYKKRGLNEDDALIQARCAYILKMKRDMNKKGKIRLWEPPRLSALN